MLFVAVEKDDTQPGWYQITILQGEPDGKELRPKVVRLSYTGLKLLESEIHDVLAKR